MKTVATEPLPKYIYMPLPSGEADVFIYKLIGEDKDGALIYESNEFRTTIPEGDIAKDPFKYLECVQENGKRIETRVSELETKIETLTYTLNQISDAVTEVFKIDDSEMPIGDYVNPITFETGILVRIGLFYTDGNDIWECIKMGYPTKFADNEYFDVIAY